MTRRRGGADETPRARQQQQQQQQQQHQHQQQQQRPMQPLQPQPQSPWPQEGPIELAGDLCLVKRVLSNSAFGYPANVLVGASVLTVLHPEDHLNVVQTARALLASTVPQGVISGKVRIFFRGASGEPELAPAEMSLTAFKSPMQEMPATLLMSA